MTVKFFIDFDGTITKDDVVDMILSRFADTQWREIEEEWVQGKIGSRECLIRQMSLVNTSQKKFNRLLQEVKIDKNFVHFLKSAVKLAVPVTIVSDGFDLVIREVMKHALKQTPGLLKKLPVYSNHLTWVGKNLVVNFSEKNPCGHGCGNCKPKIMKQLSKRGDFKVFVGDGYSDRFAADEADLTFAKHELLEICEEKKINHQIYVSFKEITYWLCKQKGSFK